MCPIGYSGPMERSAPAREKRHDVTPMRSPVNWALLGLIIERPSYAYDLAQRFERRYGATLPLSNVGHIYTALGALGDRGLVEEIPGTREGRQPRPHYQASESGRVEYRQWLIGQAGEDRRRHQLFVLSLAALASTPQEMLEVMDGYEQAWLQEGMATSLSDPGRSSVDVVSAMLRRLMDEGQRLAVGSKLAWVQYVRQEFAKLERR
jgi:DNA-binding PadR family transcriptional regulator